MPPIDPATVTSADPRSPMAPPYVDENPNLALVQKGLDAAEDEIREAVADAYEERALLSEDPQAALDDIDFTESEEPSLDPETAALHVEDVPDDDDEDENDGAA